MIELSRPPNVQTLVAPYKKDLAAFKKKADELKYYSLTSGATPTTNTTMQAVSEHHKQRLDSTSNIL